MTQNFKTLRADFEAHCREHEPLTTLFKTLGTTGNYIDKETELKFSAYKRAYLQYRNYIRNRITMGKPFVVARCTDRGLQLNPRPHLHNRETDSVEEAERLHKVHGAQFMVLGKVHLTPKIALPTSPILETTQVTQEST